MKLIGCAFRKMGASLCPTEITAQDTNACNFLLMWVPFKLGEWLSSVPHSLKYIMYLHILFEKINFQDVLGVRTWPLGYITLQKLVFRFLEDGSYLQMFLGHL